MELIKVYYIGVHTDKCPECGEYGLMQEHLKCYRRLIIRLSMVYSVFLISNNPVAAQSGAKVRFWELNLARVNYNS